MPATIAKRAAILLALSLLAGCMASPEQRVRVALVNAGVPDGVAHCMAKRMVAKLSIDQLKELKQLEKLVKTDPDKKLTAHRLLRQAEAIDDPEVVKVTTRAAIGCYILG